jgi:hypothetical protein
LIETPTSGGIVVGLARWRRFMSRGENQGAYVPLLSFPSSLVFDRGSLEPLFRSFCAAARDTSHEPLDEASLKLEAGDDAAWLAWEADERFLAESTVGNDANADADAHVLAIENALARGCSERVRDSNRGGDRTCGHPRPSCVSCSSTARRFEISPWAGSTRTSAATTRN